MYDTFGNPAANSIAFYVKNSGQCPNKPQLAAKSGDTFSPQTTVILDYSLAGLFALWAFSKSGLCGMTGIFSSSLWFDGRGEYTAAHTVPQRIAKGLMWPMKV